MVNCSWLVAPGSCLMAKMAGLAPGPRWAPALTCSTVVVTVIVSASRSPPGLDPKRVDFWSSFSPGSEKDPLLELTLALGEVFVVIFG